MKRWSWFWYLCVSFTIWITAGCWRQHFLWFRHPGDTMQCIYTQCNHIFSHTNEKLNLVNDVYNNISVINGKQQFGRVQIPGCSLSLSVEHLTWTCTKCANKYPNISAPKDTPFSCYRLLLCKFEKFSSVLSYQVNSEKQEFARLSLHETTWNHKRETRKRACACFYVTLGSKLISFAYGFSSNYLHVVCIICIPFRTASFRFCESKHGLQNTTCPINTA